MADAYQQAQPDPRRRHIVILPYLGVHSLMGKLGNDFNAGFRTGFLGGYQLNPSFSLNGELLIDIPNPKNGDNVTMSSVELTFSPFFHLPAGPVEMVFGPKVGVGGLSHTYEVGSSKTETRVSSFVLGSNVGAFFPLGDMLSIGGLLTFDIQPPIERCRKVNDSSEVCNKDNLGDAAKVFGTMVAVLF